MGPLVIVRWMDILSHRDTWSTPEDALSLRPLGMTTCGTLVSETDTHLTIAGTISDDGSHLGNIDCIPIGAVETVEIAIPSQMPQDPACCVPPQNHPETLPTP